MQWTANGLLDNGWDWTGNERLSVDWMADGLDGSTDWTSLAIDGSRWIKWLAMDLVMEFGQIVQVGVARWNGLAISELDGSAMDQTAQQIGRVWQLTDFDGLNGL